MEPRLWLCNGSAKWGDEGQSHRQEGRGVGLEGVTLLRWLRQGLCPPASTAVCGSGRALSSGQGAGSIEDTMVCGPAAGNSRM